MWPHFGMGFVIEFVFQDCWILNVMRPPNSKPFCVWTVVRKRVLINTGSLGSHFYIKSFDTHLQPSYNNHFHSNWEKRGLVRNNPLKIDTPEWNEPWDTLFLHGPGILTTIYWTKQNLLPLFLPIDSTHGSLFFKRFSSILLFKF